AGASAIALDGPKGVGKTNTAQRRTQTTVRLDNAAEREIIAADFPLATLPPRGTVLLDEWQQLPQVWDSVRRQVDAGAAPGRFLLTGSATPRDGAGTHSGAGRILSLRMRPMGLHERGDVTPTVSLRALLAGDADIGGSATFGLRDYAAAIVDSGFPGIMRQGPRVRRAQLDAYLLRIIDRDLPDAGFAVRRPETLRRWLTAYAAASSTTTAYSRLLDATTGGDGGQPTKVTTASYRDHLSRIWIVDPVAGWLPSNSPIRRAQLAPKHQLADPALAARLLGITAEGLLSAPGAHMAGPLFESLVTLGVRTMAQAAEARVSHMRLNGGEHEIDLVIEGDAGQILGLEVKLSPTVSAADVRHLLWLRRQMPRRVVDLAVVTTGTTAYRREDGVAVIPLALLGP
ncbi:MAG: ATP-binding protein, partial [Actinobacteria bacterium]|nr:ATP-binding protein [Actinomycetota bacterium]